MDEVKVRVLFAIIGFILIVINGLYVDTFTAFMAFMSGFCIVVLIPVLGKAHQ